MTAQLILNEISAEKPELIANIEIVGRWLWAKFTNKPDKDMRQYLKDKGFRFNGKRKVWQHSCGIPCRHAPYDPRDKYHCLPATLAVQDEKL